MKVIPLHKDHQQLIEKAKRGERRAQKLLFETFSSKMLGVCRQYLINLDLAEEVMLSAFLKVFLHLNDFKGEGSFEGWIRRIMIHECISYLRAEKKIDFYGEEKIENAVEHAVTSENTLEVEEIQELIDSLPEGYKTVFVLYVVEGYKHKEISELLSISENTSKSQLSKARKMLQDRIKKQNLFHYESK